MSARVYSSNAERQRAHRARKAAAAGRDIQGIDPYLDGHGRRVAERCSCAHSLVVDPEIPTCLFCGRWVPRAGDRISSARPYIPVAGVHQVSYEKAGKQRQQVAA